VSAIIGEPRDCSTARAACTVVCSLSHGIAASTAPALTTTITCPRCSLPAGVWMAWTSLVRTPRALHAYTAFRGHSLQSRSNVRARATPVGVLWEQGLLHGAVEQAIWGGVHALHLVEHNALEGQRILCKQAAPSAAASHHRSRHTSSVPHQTVCPSGK